MPLKDPQKRKEYNKKYRDNHREYLIEYARLWRKNNQDKIKANIIKCCKQNQADDYKHHKEWIKQNPDKMKASSRRYYLKHKSILNKKSKIWYLNNKDKSRIYHRENIKIKRTTDIKFHIDDTMSNAIYWALKRNKMGKRWTMLVGYTLKDLMTHLEDLFDKQMTWDNYGSYWHVDHIKPKSLFYYETAEDPEFKKCWALENLQPLEARENLRKSNHY